jgi:uncharacterized protein
MGSRRVKDRAAVIARTESFVRERFEGEASGHDWWHVYRVWRTAVAIGKIEQVDLDVVELAALLHDVADAKFHAGDEEIGSRTAAAWLRSLDVDEPTVRHVARIIRDMSFKEAGVEPPLLTREGMVVQDADRLDALGAIGIARAFAYGGLRGRVLYDPELAPAMHASVEAYRSHQGSTINHFYEKLLLLKDRMHTDAGREIASERHGYMECFVRAFLAEWHGVA